MPYYEIKEEEYFFLHLDLFRLSLVVSVRMSKAERVRTISVDHPNRSETSRGALACELACQINIACLPKRLNRSVFSSIDNLY